MDRNSWKIDNFKESNQDEILKILVKKVSKKIKNDNPKSTNREKSLMQYFKN